MKKNEISYVIKEICKYSNSKIEDFNKLVEYDVASIKKRGENLISQLNDLINFNEHLIDNLNNDLSELDKKQPHRNDNYRDDLFAIICLFKNFINDFFNVLPEFMNNHLNYLLTPYENNYQTLNIFKLFWKYTNDPDFAKRLESNAKRIMTKDLPKDTWQSKKTKPTVMTKDYMKELISYRDEALKDYKYRKPTPIIKLYLKKTNQPESRYAIIYGFFQKKEIQKKIPGKPLKIFMKVKPEQIDELFAGLDKVQTYYKK